MEMTNYISCACNCQPNAVDWGKSGLVCYGYSNAIAIYNPDAHITGKVLKTYHKHSSQVKVVQWIDTDDDDDDFGIEILSGSLDGTIIIWTRKENDDTYNTSTVLTLGDSLTATHAIHLKKANNDDEFRPLLVCASSFKDIFKIWRRNTSGSIQDEQILNLKKRIPTQVRMAFLPGPQCIPIVIIALDDASIHIFAWNNQNNDAEINFVHIKELKGHQSWIQCLDIAQSNENEAILASGSQDGTIRLWKIMLLTAENYLNDERINKFTFGDNCFGILLESVLSGHEHWVYGVHWHPVIKDDNGKYKRPLKLLSCALDKTMIIWEPNTNGVWVETVRLGKVGGNALGYYGCKFNKDGSSVLAHGYQGTFHMWKYNESKDMWFPRTAPSGHFSDVTDLHWDPNGKYLLTTSSDQTTRIHIPWRPNQETQEDDLVWHEIARPQIHGYDINCLAILSSTMFASGADEKVVRIFEAPNYFVESLNNDTWSNPKNVTDSASVPALGLTNKAHNNNELQENFDDNNLQCDLPPTEEEIIRHTLWPELEKLYGHGYEIFSMSARHDGRLLATASKANNAEHSSIILWNTKSWTQVQKLSSHRLTVTQIAFSPNDKLLVSVSRDRRWALYCCVDDDNEKMMYNLVGMSSKDNPLHTRIIWCCAWTHDSKYFATGSRDGKIGIWTIESQQNSNDIKLITSLDFGEASVTAIAFASEFASLNTYVLAIGFDDGRIEIQKIDLNHTNASWISCIKFDTSQAHHKTVKKLSFRPSSQKEFYYLASCSSDSAVKIHKLNIQK
ncbi:hypothetical protein PV325_013856 [Microctonus aethiopoides]|nr:hypothetical protein PV325_013856 [Microctonus aethiopoides]